MECLAKAKVVAGRSPQASSPAAGRCHDVGLSAASNDQQVAQLRQLEQTWMWGWNGKGQGRSQTSEFGYVYVYIYIYILKKTASIARVQNLSMEPTQELHEIHGSGSSTHVSSKLCDLGLKNHGHGRMRIWLVVWFFALPLWKMMDFVSWNDFPFPTVSGKS